MIADLKPYPSYKDSGVPWLGQIPDHWTLPRLKTVLKERIEKGYPFEPLLAATQTKGVIRKEQYENRTVLALKDLHLLKLVRRGDFVISLRSFQGGIEFAREQGIISPAYTVLYPINSDTHGYLAKLFKSKPYIENLTLHVTGIRQGQNIDYTKLARSVASLPPPPEQAAIVRYLDYVDRDIRKYIRAKQKLIKLLEEQKQAIIHQAVTRGLNPDVPMKPSGVEWLGDVPAHWTKVRLKQVSKVQTGITLGKNYLNTEVVNRPYLRVANVQSGYLNLKTVKRIDVPLADAVRCELKAGDVLMTEGGDIDKLGRGCVWHGEIEGCLHQNHIFAVRSHQARLLPEYLVSLMGSEHGRNYFQITAKRTTNLASTNSTTLGAFPIFLPDTFEQQRIMDWIYLQTKDLEIAIKLFRQEIELITYYRTRLIADVVTGKVDVREIAARLPEMDESDILEEAVPDDEVVDTEEAELSAEDTDAEC